MAASACVKWNHTTSKTPFTEAEILKSDAVNIMEEVLNYYEKKRTEMLFEECFLLLYEKGRFYVTGG